MPHHTMPLLPPLLLLLQNMGRVAPNGECGAFLAASPTCVNLTSYMSASSHSWVLEAAGGPGLFRIALQRTTKKPSAFDPRVSEAAHHSSVISAAPSCSPAQYLWPVGLAGLPPG